MKPDGRRANHNVVIVEKSWPNRIETLIISVKLQPNVIRSQLGVISVRNRISRLKKLCIIKPMKSVPKVRGLPLKLSFLLSDFHEIPQNVTLISNEFFGIFYKAE